MVYHGLASLLVGVVGHRVMHLPARWSVWAGALFAVHPVHTENLMYLVGRADIICSIFICAAALVYEWSAQRIPMDLFWFQFVGRAHIGLWQVWAWGHQRGLVHLPDDGDARELGRFRDFDVPDRDVRPL